MSKISTEEARSYLERWQLVERAELVELRTASTKTKFRQLAALMEARDLFATEPDRELQAQQVHERWARLRRALSA